MDIRIQNLSVLVLDRADLEEAGVDSTRLDDADFRYLARKLADALLPCFWESLDVLAEELELPRLNSSKS